MPAAAREVLFFEETDALLDSWTCAFTAGLSHMAPTAPCSDAHFGALLFDRRVKRTQSAALKR
jgi:hypothetical protein